jgi:predicted nicotinamide N-methyase
MLRVATWAWCVSVVLAFGRGHVRAQAAQAVECVCAGGRPFCVECDGRSDPSVVAQAHLRNSLQRDGLDVDPRSALPEVAIFSGNVPASAATDHKEVSSRQLESGVRLVTVASTAPAPGGLELRDVIGLKAWPCSLFLADFLHQQQQAALFGPGSRVLELGAGVGLVGLSLAALGASVDMTDRQPAVLERIRLNVHANRHGLAGSARAWRYEWGSAECDHCPLAKYDVVIGSDILYADSMTGPHQMLLDALLHAAAGHTRIWLASQWRRNTNAEAFFARARQTFEVRIVASRDNTGGDVRDADHGSSLKVFELTLKQPQPGTEAGAGSGGGLGATALGKGEGEEL